MATERPGAPVLPCCTGSAHLCSLSKPGKRSTGQSSSFQKQLFSIYYLLELMVGTSDMGFTACGEEPSINERTHLSFTAVRSEGRRL